MIMAIMPTAISKTGIAMGASVNAFVRIKIAMASIGGAEAPAEPLQAVRKSPRTLTFAFHLSVKVSEVHARVYSCC